MDLVADLARAVLAVVFTVAAVAKLLDLSGSIRTMLEFGVPPRLAAIAGRGLPIAELGTAILLVINDTAWLGGIAALVLLLAFIAGIANSLSHGLTPDCNCFGQVASEPVSSRTIIRNSVLAALTIPVIVNGSGSSLLAWSGSRSAAETIAVLLALALVAGGVVLLHTRREYQRLRGRVGNLERLTGMLPRDLAVGTPAPAFALPDVNGNTVSLTSLYAQGRPVLLMFVGPNCGSCVEMFPDLARWNTALSERVTFAVVSNGGLPAEQIAEHLSPLGDVLALVQESQEVADLYRIFVTPTAIVVDERGRIANAPASGAREIEALVRVVLEGEYDTASSSDELVIHHA
jgi:methylamine dehydrogenase accessory protein MauD